MNAGGVDKACKLNGTEAARPKYSGERVSNTLATYLEDGHSSPKGGVIPDTDAGAKVIRIQRSNPLQDRPRSHQLVGRVMAYQGNDG